MSSAIPTTRAIVRPYRAVTTATYTVTRSKVAGLWWYRIGGTGGNRGKYFKPNRYTHITVI